MKKFIDVSQVQRPDSINWHKVKANGIDAVYVRCGEGLYSQDTAFRTHAERARAAGLRVGAYYVMAPSTQKPKECAFQAQAWGDVEDAMPLVIDVERNRPLENDAKRFAEFFEKMVENIEGRVILYTYKNMFLELKPFLTKAHPLWVAAYPTLRYPTPQAELARLQCLQAMTDFALAVKAGDAKAAKTAADQRHLAALTLSKLGQEPMPQGGVPTDCIGWQWGGDANAATCAGVEGFCDRSNLYVTDEEWEGFYLHPRPIPEPPKMEPIVEKEFTQGREDVAPIVRVSPWIAAGTALAQLVQSRC